MKKNICNEREFVWSFQKMWSIKIHENWLHDIIKWSCEVKE